MENLFIFDTKRNNPIKHVQRARTHCIQYVWFFMLKYSLDLRKNNAIKTSVIRVLHFNYCYVVINNSTVELLYKFHRSQNTCNRQSNNRLLCHDFLHPKLFPPRVSKYLFEGLKPRKHNHVNNIKLFKNNLQSFWYNKLLKNGRVGLLQVFVESKHFGFLYTFNCLQNNSTCFNLQ